MSLHGSPRYLFIRRDNIGDLVCTTPLIAALRARNPEAYIGALVNSYNREILQGNADIDEVFAYTKAKHRGSQRSLLGVLAERAQMFYKLRLASIDLAILATPGYQARSLNLARFAGSKSVLGFVNHAGEGGINMGIPSEAPPGLHEVEEVFRLAPALGLEANPPPMNIVPDQHLKDSIGSRFAASFGFRSGAIVALHISARKPSQRWPVERFVEVARVLSSASEARILLLWSPGTKSNVQHPGDDEKAAMIVESLHGVPLLPLPTPQLRELIAAIANCDLMICADGGAMHIAAALAKPVVSLFGDSTASRWHPWKTRYELLQPESRNVSDIRADEVIEASLRILDTGRLRQ